MLEAFAVGVLVTFIGVSLLVVLPRIEHWLDEETANR
jgi:hypothetical protein